MKGNYDEELYSKDVMKMIGEQVVPDRAAREDIEKVVKAHMAAGNMDVYSIAIDCFLLGSIHGKRQERADRKGRAV